MRGCARAFFREVGAERDLTFAAYLLAYLYKVSPDQFLDLYPDDLMAHLTETMAMMKRAKIKIGGG